MFTKKNDIDLTWLKKNHSRLYFFGLGFIQLKINEKYRLHFYIPELPSFVDQPHNHRYDFTSLILKGEITNNIFKEIPGEDFIVQEDSCSEGFIPSQKPRKGNFQLESSIIYKTGESYNMAHNLFHTVKAKSCITLLNRSEYKKELAEISYLKNQTKMCPFQNKISDQSLWKYIEKSLED